MITIEQIDAFIKRTGASYETAKAYLSANDGDVDAAVLQYEKETNKKQPFSFKDLSDAIRHLVAKSNGTALRVCDKKQKTVLSLSLTVSAIGVVLAPALSAIGIGVMALSDYTFYIDKEDGSSINVNEWIMGSNKADDRTSNDPDQGTDA